MCEVSMSKVLDIAEDKAGAYKVQLHAKIELSASAPTPGMCATNVTVRTGTSVLQLCVQNGGICTEAAWK